MPREETDCRLIIGIGNPGEEYAGTRHNAGFETVDRFLAKHQAQFSPRHARSGQAWEGRFCGRNVIFLKPQTYVNLSGEAVLPLMQGEKMTPEELNLFRKKLGATMKALKIREKINRERMDLLRDLIDETDFAIDDMS